MVPQIWIRLYAILSDGDNLLEVEGQHGVTQQEGLAVEWQETLTLGGLQ